MTEPRTSHAPPTNLRRRHKRWLVGAGLLVAGIMGLAAWDRSPVFRPDRRVALGGLPSERGVTWLRLASDGRGLVAGTEETPLERWEDYHARPRFEGYGARVEVRQAPADSSFYTLAAWFAPAELRRNVSPDRRAFVWSALLNSVDIERVDIASQAIEGYLADLSDERSRVRLDVVAWKPDGSEVAICGREALVVRSGRAPFEVLHRLPLVASRCQWLGTSDRLLCEVYRGGHQIVCVDLASGDHTVLSEQGGFTFGPLPVSADGRYVCVSTDRQRGLWAVLDLEQDGKETCAFELKSARFSPTEPLLAIYTNGVFEVWDARTGERVSWLSPALFTELAWPDFVWSPDGQLLATHPIRAEGPVRIWDPRTGACLARLIPDETAPLVTRPKQEEPDLGPYVSGIDWTPDGDTLAAAFYGRHVYLWDTARFRDP